LLIADNLDAGSIGRIGNNQTGLLTKNDVRLSVKLILHSDL